MPDSYQISTRLIPYSYEIGTRFVSDWYQIRTRFVRNCAVTDTAAAAISFEAKFKSTGPHRRSLTNPRVRTGSPLQIHGSAQAVPYDLEVQIATEIMRLSLPLSLSPLLMLLLLLLQLNLPLLSLLLLLLSLLLTFHFFHTRTALASNSKSRCFAQAAAQPTAISSASNGEHALPGANSNTCLLGSPLPTRRTQKDRQSAFSVCRPRPSPRPAFR